MLHSAVVIFHHDPPDALAISVLLEYTVSKVTISPIIAIIILYHRDTLSSERSQCYGEGDFSIVNITYNNYLALAIGGDYSVSGRVGVCQGGAYSSVCDTNWGPEEANATCNSFGLGFDFGE